MYTYWLRSYKAIDLGGKKLLGVEGRIDQGTDWKTNESYSSFPQMSYVYHTKIYIFQWTNKF